MNASNLQDNNGFHLEKKGSNHLIVIFGGINQGIGIPVFEFFNILQEKKVDKIFVRDFNQMWYFNGVDSEIDSFEKLKLVLSELMKDYNKITFLGNSMGGFASILFGTLLNVDQVVVFSAQTFIDQWNRFWCLDRRWKKQMKKIHDAKVNTEYWDLKKVLKNYPDNKTKINLYFSSKDKLDKIHSNRLKSFKNVYLNSFNKGGHAVIRELRDSGELQKILNQL